jgi:hypothetical protein
MDFPQIQACLQKIFALCLAVCSLVLEMFPDETVPGLDIHGQPQVPTAAVLVREVEFVRSEFDRELLALIALLQRLDTKGLLMRLDFNEYYTGARTSTAEPRD